MEFGDYLKAADLHAEWVRVDDLIRSLEKAPINAGKLWWKEMPISPLVRDKLVELLETEKINLIDQINAI